MIDFALSFEFKSRLLQTVVEGLFLEVVRRMVGALEQRAQHIYDKQGLVGGIGSGIISPPQNRSKNFGG
jgi:coenzyme Q-binding protein COQ10